MNNLSLKKLNIDPEFKSLASPLSSKEFEQLEANIISEGCLEPIAIWNGTIIDGHNRYAICHKNNIPFFIRNISFSSREEAITWICENQLNRHNLPEETKKYLIGKKYETKKIIAAKNAPEICQPISTASIPSHNKTARKIGKEFNISYNTVYKYGIYAKALDRIQRKCPDIAHKILSGNIRISHENTINLSGLSKDELRSLLEYLSDETEVQIRYSDMKQELQLKPLQKIPKKLMPVLQNDILIKQLPKYDPDAEISSLSLTIPSWILSMNRTKLNTNFKNITGSAKSRLTTQLINLRSAIDDLMLLAKEE